MSDSDPNKDIWAQIDKQDKKERTPITVSADPDPEPVQQEAVEEQAIPVEPVQQESDDEKDQRIKDLEDQLVRLRTAQLDEAIKTDKPIAAAAVPVVDVPPGSVIHFVEDGFTAWGAVWYKGQEVNVDPDGDNYKATLDRDGATWLSQSENDQYYRFGKVMWRWGPWPGNREGAQSKSPVSTHPPRI